MKFVSTAVALLSVASYVSANCTTEDLSNSCAGKINDCMGTSDQIECIIKEYCTCAQDNGCVDASELGLPPDLEAKFDSKCDLSANEAPPPAGKDTKPAPPPPGKETKPAPPPPGKETKPAPPPPPGKETKPAPAPAEKETKPAPPPAGKETKPAPAPAEKETKPAPAGKETKPPPAPEKPDTLPAPNPFVKALEAAMSEQEAYDQLDTNMATLADLKARETKAMIAKAISKKQTKPN